MNSTTRPQAVIWDMDGTLIDQTGPIIRCYAEVISAMGYPKPDPQTIHRSMGGPMASTMSLFVKAEELDEAGRRFRALFPEIMFDGLVILPGALEAIEYFASEGTPQAILTNKHGDTARLVSKHCGFSKTISICIGNTDTEWHKPQSALTKHVLDQMGASANGAILIGDSTTDVATALNADLECIGITTGAHSERELLDAGATSVFPDLIEMRTSYP